MSSYEEILKTEYSEEFDTLRKNRMVISYHKYGAMRANYKTEKAIDAIKSMEMRIQKYKDTGNTEFLVDAANFAMIEYIYPQHPKAHFRATDSGESPGVHGMSVAEANAFFESVKYE